MKTSNKILGLLILVIIIIAAALVFMSFNLQKITNTVVEGAGTSKTISKKLDSLKSLDITGPYYVKIKFARENSISITGDSNIVQFIKCTAENGKLYIGSTKPVLPKTDIEIDIKTVDLDNLDLWGVKETYIYGIKTDNFEFSINGKGNLFADGSCQNLGIECNGESAVDTGKLKAENVKVDLFGDGNVRTFADKTLEVDISGAGSFTGYGATNKLIIKCSGAGNINTEKLKAYDVDVELNGASKARVYVENKLNVNISGLGKVVYKGNPKEVKQNILGLGKLVNGNRNNMEN